MSITAAAIFGGILTGISHPVTTFSLLTANTVMNGIGLKNDSDIKAGISSANSRLAQVQDSLDELQGICAKTCSVDDIHSMFAPVPTPTLTPTLTPTPTSPVPAPAPVQDNNVPPVWAQQLIQHQIQQDAVIKTLMDQQNTAPAVPANTTVNVNPSNTSIPSTPPVDTPATVPSADDKYITKADFEKAMSGFTASVSDIIKNSIAAMSAPPTTTPTQPVTTPDDHDGVINIHVGDHWSDEDEDKSNQAYPAPSNRKRLQKRKKKKKKK